MWSAQDSHTKRVPGCSGFNRYNEIVIAKKNSATGKFSGDKGKHYVQPCFLFKQEPGDKNIELGVGKQQGKRQ